jgi:hypothetical protein
MPRFSITNLANSCYYLQFVMLNRNILNHNSSHQEQIRGSFNNLGELSHHINYDSQ